MTAAQVTVVGRDQGRIDTAVAKVCVETSRDDARGAVCDPGTPEGTAALIAAQPQADILVNGFGIYGTRDFFDIDDALWDEFFQVNIMKRCTSFPSLCQGHARAWLGPNSVYIK